MAHIEKESRFRFVCGFRGNSGIVEHLLTLFLVYSLLPQTDINTHSHKRRYRNGDNGGLYGCLLVFIEENIAVFHIHFHAERTDYLVRTCLTNGIAGGEDMSPGRVHYLLRIDSFARKCRIDIRYHFLFNICAGISEILRIEVKSVDKIDEPAVISSLCSIKISRGIERAELVERLLKFLVSVGFHIIDSVYVFIILAREFV